jgi:hypothetical protein
MVSNGKWHLEYQASSMVGDTQAVALDATTEKRALLEAKRRWEIVLAEAANKIARPYDPRVTYSRPLDLNKGKKKK